MIRSQGINNCEQKDTDEIQVVRRLCLACKSRTNDVADSPDTIHNPHSRRQFLQTQKFHDKWRNQSNQCAAIYPKDTRKRTLSSVRVRVKRKEGTYYT